MRLATEAEINAAGAVAGYGSAIGARGALVVVDEAISASPNLVAGANEAGYHLLNTNYGRDYTAEVVADIAAAREGDTSPDGAGTLRAVRGVEVGNIFKLGTRYSDALGCTFLDKDGQTKPVIMGSYGIGIGRLLACIAEQHNDANGLIWPVTVAPYQVYLMFIGDDPEVRAKADALYKLLTVYGLEVLYDDRDERAGVKFNDADLIGLPLRVTVSGKTLAQGGVEVKRRAGGDARLIPLDSIAPELVAELDALRGAIQATVTEVPFRE
jgi:prolyl-tRNA synthetase